MKRNHIILILYLWSGCMALPAQLRQTECSVGYKEYTEKVWKQNLSFAAEKLNIDIAEAEVKVAGLFSDFQLSVEYGNNEDKRLQMGQNVSAALSKTFSPGKRHARIDLAKSEKDLNIALLEDYFRNLRAEATIAYLEAIKQSELFRVKQNAYENFRQLAEGDSVKYSLGKITKVDAIQSNLEAGMMFNELLQARTDLLNAFSSLNLQVGIFKRDTLYIPSGNLNMEERLFNTDELLESAMKNRTDLAVAMKNTEVAQKALTLTKRERNMDFDLSLGISHNTEVRNEIAPAPRYNGVTVGVAIPLPFSILNRGAVQAAKLRVQQSEINYHQTELEIQTGVIQNLRQYWSLEEQVRRYDTGLLERAKEVIEGKIYSYNRGETSLLEVLNAQRTYDELRTTYIETLYNRDVSLVELELSAGIWDITIE